MAGALRSPTVAPLEPGTDGPSSDQWYNVLGGPSPGAHQGETAHGSIAEPIGTPEGLDRSISGTEASAAGGADNTATLFEAVRQLTEQNARLADRLDVLARSQERDEDLRGRLESKIDRLFNMPAAGQSDEREPLHDAVCRRIEESMKPFFLAIIDLLELSVRRAPAAPNPPSAAQRATDDQTLSQPDEPPGGLPEILTKPLEELIDAAGDRARPTAQDEMSQRGSRPTATSSQAASQGSRAFSWTPVIPEDPAR